MRKADNLPPSCAVVTKSGNLNFLEPSGHLGPVTGLIYLLLHFHLSFCPTHIQAIPELVSLLKVKFALEEATNAHRFSSTRSSPTVLDEVGLSTSRSGHYTPVNRAVTNYTEDRVDPALVCTGAENLASTVIRSPDRPNRSESLYLLSYPGPVSIILLLLTNIFLISEVTP